MSAVPLRAVAEDDGVADDLAADSLRSDAFVVDVDGWEGPLDLLLTLARAQ